MNEKQSWRFGIKMDGFLQQSIHKHQERSEEIQQQTAEEKVTAINTQFLFSKLLQVCKVCIHSENLSFKLLKCDFMRKIMQGSLKYAKSMVNSKLYYAGVKISI